MWCSVQKIGIERFLSAKRMRKLHIRERVDEEHIFLITINVMNMLHGYLDRQIYLTNHKQCIIMRKISND